MSIVKGKEEDKEQKEIVFDLEADGFLEDATKIHCLCIDDGSKVEKSFHKRIVDLGLPTLNSATSLVGHNIIGYDIPLIKRIHGVDVSEGKEVVDTFILSSLLYPEGTHSLEAWGVRLGGEQKVQHEDWSTYTPEMLERCKSDVRINESLWRHFKEEMSKDLQDDKIDWAPAINLEQEVAEIHVKQVKHGVRFDVLKAASLLKEFDSRMEELTALILKDAPMITEVHKGPPVSKPFKKDFTLSSSVVSYFGGDEDQLKMVGGPFSRINIRSINLDSTVEVKGWLLKEGWKPTEWTDKGSPKLTEELKGLEDSSVGVLFQELHMLKHRRNFLLNKNLKGGALTKVRKDGRVPAEAFTCATPTARYRHSGAVCNIPRPSTAYGKEIRSLFCVPEGHTMIGADLCGIEARMMCHFAYNYPGGKELAELVLTGDFHQHNADAWGVSRDLAKNGLYALMYSCGDSKLASTLGKPKGQGKKLKDIFWKSNPALKHLIADLEKAYDSRSGERKWIRGLDGRKLFIREKRKLLNSLLQNGATIVFKKWMVECDGWIDKYDWIHQIIAYHDELQFEVEHTRPEDLAVISEWIKEAAKNAGEQLMLNVPIAADTKMGQTWRDTH